MIDNNREKQILNRLAPALREAARLEVPLKRLVERLKRQPEVWDVWMKHKAHLVTFFMLESQTARTAERQVKIA